MVRSALGRDDPVVPEVTRRSVKTRTERVHRRGGLDPLFPDTLVCSAHEELQAAGEFDHDLVNADVSQCAHALLDSVDLAAPD